MGPTMLINDNYRDADLRAIEIVKKGGGKISFDPRNFRPELLGADKARELFLSPWCERKLYSVSDLWRWSWEVLSGEKDIDRGKPKCFLSQGDLK